MRIGFERNAYETLVSVHVCQMCLERYTVCPPAGKDFGGCQAAECLSYDVSRDADKMFDDPDVEIVCRIGVGGSDGP